MLKCREANMGERRHQMMNQSQTWKDSLILLGHGVEERQKVAVDHAEP